MTNLEDNDYYLKRLEMDDVDPMTECVLESKASFMPWIKWCTEDYSTQDAFHFIELGVGGKNINWHPFSIVRKSDGKMMGSISVSVHQKKGVIGYWIRESEQRKGIITRALKLILNYAFIDQNLNYVTLVVAENNIPSRKAAETTGAVVAETIKNYMTVAGITHDAVVYKLIRPENYALDTSK